MNSLFGKTILFPAENDKYCFWIGLGCLISIAHDDDVKFVWKKSLQYSMHIFSDEFKRAFIICGTSHLEISFDKII